MNVILTLRGVLLPRQTLQDDGVLHEDSALFGALLVGVAIGNKNLPQR